MATGEEKIQFNKIEYQAFEHDFYLKICIANDWAKIPLTLYPVWDFWGLPPPPTPFSAEIIKNSRTRLDFRMERMEPSSVSDR